MSEPHSDEIATLDEMALTGFDEAAVHTYRRTQCAVFRKTAERFGGLSNMAAGFPLWVNGIEIRTSEAIYQSARFPHLPDVQRDILAQASPMAAKMKAKPHRRVSRPDFDTLRVPIMWWSLRVKLACNPEAFPRLLASTAGVPIVEDSHKDAYWGAVALRGEPNVLQGANVLGRLLDLLRDVVETVDRRVWQVVPPPRIDDFTLLGEPIGMVDGAAGRSAPRESAIRSLEALCPRCFIVLPANGRCDNCD
jgi:ribA/ribD-fused uncharacterized protein